MKERNEFVLRGTIISLNVGSKFATVRLAVDGGHGNSNVPSVVFFDPKLLKGISIRQRVWIHGHTQNRRFSDPKTGKKTNQTNLVCDKIEPAKRMLLDYFNSDEIIDVPGGVADDINKVLWVGTVLKVYVPNEKSRISILRVGNISDNQHRQCDFSCFERQSDIANTLNEGDKVAVIGRVTTSSKEKEGQIAYYQNIVCQDLCKVES